MTGGRVCLNVVIGHTPEEQHFYGDFLSHDERFERTDEFLTVCRALWDGSWTSHFPGKVLPCRRGTAEYTVPLTGAGRSGDLLGGSSPAAIRLAVKHSDCLLTFPDAPAVIAERVRPVLERRQGGRAARLSAGTRNPRGGPCRDSGAAGAGLGAVAEDAP